MRSSRTCRSSSSSRAASRSSSVSVGDMLRRAHAALAVLFVCFGAVDGTWTARLPAVKERLHLDSGRLGIAIFAVSLTATAMLAAAGWLASRFGSRGPAGLGLL